MDFQTNQVKFVSYDIKYFFYMTIYICYVLRITEEEKIEGAVDVSESVYYLHNLSTPIVHQHIATRLLILVLSYVSESVYYLHNLSTIIVHQHIATRLLILVLSYASESVYYLHNLSTPIVHQHIATRLLILLLSYFLNLYTTYITYPHL